MELSSNLNMKKRKLSLNTNSGNSSPEQVLNWFKESNEEMLLISLQQNQDQIVKAQWESYFMKYFNNKLLKVLVAFSLKFKDFMLIYNLYSCNSINDISIVYLVIPEFIDLILDYSIESLSSNVQSHDSAYKILNLLTQFYDCFYSRFKIEATHNVTILNLMINGAYQVNLKLTVPFKTCFKVCDILHLVYSSCLTNKCQVFIHGKSISSVPFDENILVFGNHLSILVLVHRNSIHELFQLYSKSSDFNGQSLFQLLYLFGQLTNIFYSHDNLADLNSVYHSTYLLLSHCYANTDTLDFAFEPLLLNLQKLLVLHFSESNPCYSLISAAARIFNHFNHFSIENSLLVVMYSYCDSFVTRDCLSILSHNRNFDTLLSLSKQSMSSFIHRGLFYFDAIFTQLLQLHTSDESRQFIVESAIDTLDNFSNSLPKHFLLFLYENSEDKIKFVKHLQSVSIESLLELLQSTEIDEEFYRICSLHSIGFCFKKLLNYNQHVDKDNNGSVISYFKILELLCSDSNYQSYSYFMNKFLPFDYIKDHLESILTMRQRSDCSPKKYGKVGLLNLGFTCYFNSLVQQLFHIKGFIDAIYSCKSSNKLDAHKDNSGSTPGPVESFNNEENVNDSNQLLWSLQNLFARMKYSDAVCICPIDAINCLELDISVQMDIDEFLALFFDKLEQFMLKDMKNLFQGELKQEIIGDCNHVSSRIETFYCLQVEVKGVTKLGDALENYVREEVLDGDDRYLCEQCCPSTKVYAKKRVRFNTLPECLFISLKRFDYDLTLMKRNKINDYFEFEPQLVFDSSLLSFSSNAPVKYNLKGVVVHMGTADSGHYLSYVVDRDQWFLFNDSQVQLFDMNNIGNDCFGGESKRYSAYVLVYELAKEPYRTGTQSDCTFDIVKANTDILPNQHILGEISKENYEMHLIRTVFQKDFIKVPEKMLDYIQDDDYEMVLLIYTLISCPCKVTDQDGQKFIVWLSEWTKNSEKCEDILLNFIRNNKSFLENLNLFFDEFLNKIPFFRKEDSFVRELFDIECGFECLIEYMRNSQIDLTEFYTKFNNEIHHQHDILLRNVKLLEDLDKIIVDEEDRATLQLVSTKKSNLKLTVTEQMYFFAMFISVMKEDNLEGLLNLLMMISGVDMLDEGLVDLIHEILKRCNIDFVIIILEHKRWCQYKLYFGVLLKLFRSISSYESSEKEINAFLSNVLHVLNSYESSDASFRAFGLQFLFEISSNGNSSSRSSPVEDYISDSSEHVRLFLNAYYRSWIKYIQPEAHLSIRNRCFRLMERVFMEFPDEDDGENIKEIIMYLLSRDVNEGLWGRWFNMMRIILLFMDKCASQEVELDEVYKHLFRMIEIWLNQLKKNIKPNKDQHCNNDYFELLRILNHLINDHCYHDDVCEILVQHYKVLVATSLNIGSKYEKMNVKTEFIFNYFSVCLEVLETIGDEDKLEFTLALEQKAEYLLGDFNIYSKEVKKLILTVMYNTVSVLSNYQGFKKEWGERFEELKSAMEKNNVEIELVVILENILKLFRN